MSMVAGADGDDRGRVNGRTGFVDPAGFADFVGSVAIAVGAIAVGAVAARLARLALPIGRCSSCRLPLVGRWLAPAHES
jgi:hypothetical protein